MKLPCCRKICIYTLNILPILYRDMVNFANCSETQITEHLGPKSTRFAS